DAHQIRGYAVQGDDTLVEVPGSPFAAGMEIDGMAAAGGAVFAASDVVDSVAAFKVQSNGSLVAAPGSPFSVSGGGGGDLQNVFVDARGRSAYLPDPDTDPNDVFGFKVDSGSAALTPLSGSPFHIKVANVAGLTFSSKSLAFAFGPKGNSAPDLQAL